MRRLLALALVAGLAHAATVSVLDPLVKLEVTNAPLPGVLKTLTEQTGVDLTAPPQREPLTVTVKADDKPLRAVLHELCAAYGLMLAPNGRGGYQLYQAGQPLGKPVVLAVDPYRLGLGELALDRSFRVRFDGRPTGPGNQSARLELSLDADTNLKARAYVGVSPDFVLSVDGTPLKALPMSGELATVMAHDGPNGTRTVQLTALPPELNPQKSIGATGTLIACLDARERVFEFADLTAGNQQQTDGDVDVTLTRFTKREAAAPAVGANQPLTRWAGAAGPGYTVELTVSMPLDDTLSERLRNAPGGRPFMPMPMMLRDGAAPVGAAPLAGGGNVIMNHAVTIAAAANGGPPQVVINGAPVAAADPAGLKEMIARTSMPYWGGQEHPCLPAVMLETSDGKQMLASGGFNVSFGSDPAKRLTLKATFNGQLKGGAPKRLLVGAIDFGKRMSRLPFVFKDVPLSLQPLN